MPTEKVLIVEDSSTIRKHLSDGLQQYGYNIFAIDNMEDGLIWNEKYQPQTIVTDIILPGMNGIEGIKLFRKHSVETDIIAISAGTDSIEPNTILKMARQSGADAVLFKPFEISVLIKRLKAVREAKKAGTELINVLAIDDSRTVLKVIDRDIDKSKYALTVSNSVHDALRNQEVMHVDVVMIDIFMPDISGIEGIQLIKENWPMVAVIAMSGGVGDKDSRSDALKAAMKVGAGATLQKPFDTDDITKAIQSVL